MVSSSNEIAEALNGLYKEFSIVEGEISNTCIDSRLVSDPEKTLFIAIDGAKVSGADFVGGLFELGVRNFLLHEKYESRFKGLAANVFYVADTIRAWQQLIRFKRGQYSLKTIGITGSNGKTIVKEWLAQILRSDFQICKSPKSYNSQIGVPLSLWGIRNEHDLGIFEAGISKPDEMEHLERMIRPEIGILTNMGDAHQLNFESMEQKLREKLKLFIGAKKLVLNHNLLSKYKAVFNSLEKKNPQLKYFSWGHSKDADIQIQSSADGRYLELSYKTDEFQIELKSMDASYIENVSHCIATTILLTSEIQQVASQFKNLSPIEMRLEVLEGIQNMNIINDTYNADLESIAIAVQFLMQRPKVVDKSIVLSEIEDTTDESIDRILDILRYKSLNQLILIGKSFLKHRSLFGELDVKQLSFLENVDDYLKQFPHQRLHGHTVLIKGARSFVLDRIVQLYRRKTHSTYLSVHINALRDNLIEFKKLLKPKTKIMVMLKAAGYGLGSLDLARILESQEVHYYAVAYTDEGIELRNAGIQKPIMVLNPEETALNKLVEYNLEPEIYSLSIFKAFLVEMKKLSIDQMVAIHLKIETGMHRLGIMEEDIVEVLSLVKENPNVRVASIMSHLSASDDAYHDEYTLSQIQRFVQSSEIIEKHLGYTCLKHILNTGGIIRHSNYQMDMVRLGIGLFGFDSSQTMEGKLQTTVSLISKISQIKGIKAGESIGYSRSSVLERDSIIGIINIGYADGYFRSFGNGRTKVYLKDQYAPTVGNVCMDMIMVDLTDTEGVSEGDEVELLGEHIRVTELAEISNTIPYEILTAISSRVQRVYWED